MSRIEPITKEKASGELGKIYGDIEKKLGRVPNIFQNLGNSPSVLKGFLALSGASEQMLNAKLREKIALIVGETNHCNYCLSAHSTIAQLSGISQQDILGARKGQSSDKKEQAILTFAKAVVDKKGVVSDQDVSALKAAGVSDAELVEIIFVINVNMFTNYFNHITDPQIDFPAAQKL